MIKARLWPLVICLVAAASGALADEFRPAMLEIIETEPGWYTVTWKVPQSNGQPLAIGVDPHGRNSRSSLALADSDVITLEDGAN